MGALPRADLPPGAHRDLVVALHDLHHRAGWPSLRALAGEAGCSHTTISHAFSSARIPRWGILEVLVEAMGGDTAHFHRLWLAASDPVDAASTGVPRMAGRRVELAEVRRHLETGAGLMIVAGEAGIGKTRLVSTAGEGTESFLGLGHCLPLSSELPLLPVAEALRAILRDDRGHWLRTALADCPPFVAGALAPLLPELDVETSPVATDAFARHRMFTAVAVLLCALGDVRPLALVIEDLHWADGPSLDLIEHLVAHGISVPVIGTWRSADPHTEPGREEWIARLRRHADVPWLELAPLTRAETAEQLLLVTGAPPSKDVVDRIHGLAQGLPLYTEHLVAALPGQVSPRLADLLHLRLGQLQDEPWQVARALGLAQRSLTIPVLSSVTDLREDELQRALRVLTARRVVAAGGGDQVKLAHPLLAEAIRRRLLPGEAAGVHSRLAGVLAGQAEPEPGEVAHHWQHAGRPDQEIGWRVAAARSAERRFAAREQLESWTRVLELRPLTDHALDIEEWQILCKASRASSRIHDLGTALALINEALALDLDDAARVVVLRHAGDLYCWSGDDATGLGFLEEAGGLLSRLPTSPETIDVLVSRIGVFAQVGRYQEAQADLRLALDLVTTTGDLRRHREVLTWASWFAMADGDHARAWELVTSAREMGTEDPDPLSDLGLAVNATDILLFAAAPGERVEEAAVRELELAARWGLEAGYMAITLRLNVAEAYLRNAQVTRAAEILGIDAGDEPTPDLTGTHFALAAIQVRRGDVRSALARCVAAQPHVTSRDANWAESAPHHVEAALWAGELDDARSVLEEVLDLTLPTDNCRSAARALALYARVRADLLDRQGALRRDRHLVRMEVIERLRGARVDPFGPTALGAAAPTWARQWHAELGRMEVSDSVAEWTACSAEWDGFSFTHEAAYCRWRAAQVALREGQGTLAARLLKRAASDAREHVPLSHAVARTAAGTR